MSKATKHMVQSLHNSSTIRNANEPERQGHTAHYTAEENLLRSNFRLEGNTEQKCTYVQRDCPLGDTLFLFSFSYLYATNGMTLILGFSNLKTKFLKFCMPLSLIMYF